MIIKVEIRNDDGSTRKILVGDSYKTWHEQLTEYLYRSFTPIERGWHYEDGYVKDRIVKMWICPESWIGWGGLKWCSEDIFQAELNREFVQQNEADNPNPRRYSSFRFYPAKQAQIGWITRRLKRY